MAEKIDKDKIARLKRSIDDKLNFYMKNKAKFDEKDPQARKLLFSNIKKKIKEAQKLEKIMKDYKERK